MRMMLKCSIRLLYSPGDENADDTKIVNFAHHLKRMRMRLQLGVGDIYSPGVYQIL